MNLKYELINLQATSKAKVKIATSVTSINASKNIAVRKNSPKNQLFKNYLFRLGSFIRALINSVSGSTVLFMRTNDSEEYLQKYIY